MSEMASGKTWLRTLAWVGGDLWDKHRDHVPQEDNVANSVANLHPVASRLGFGWEN